MAKHTPLRSMKLHMLKSSAPGSWSLKPPKIKLLFFPQPCVHPWGFYGSSESLLLGIVGSRWSPAGPANLFDGGPCNAKGSSIIRFCSKPSLAEVCSRLPSPIMFGAMHVSCGRHKKFVIFHQKSEPHFAWQGQNIRHLFIRMASAVFRSRC